ncbi:MAG: ABC transporter permease [Verrucomicrobiota bacterium]|nr:ABC transporter permease [Verrucomicrobiota bacterium]
MSATSVTWLREVRAFRGAFSCGVPLAAFLSVCGWLFVVLLRSNEGSVLQVQSIWGLSVAPWLPILSAVLTMRLFSAERSTGMIDLLMSAPIRERELVIGKFLSALTVVAVTLGVSLAVPLLLLPAQASVPVLGSVRAVAFAATFLILLLQAAAWCAAGTLVSVLFRNQAAAAVSSLVLCAGVPVAVYAAVLAWMPDVRATTAWMPLLMHVYDFSTGLFSTSVIALYAAVTVFCLFACSKLLAFLRMRG